MARRDADDRLKDAMATWQLLNSTIQTDRGVEDCDLTASERVIDAEHGGYLRRMYVFRRGSPTEGPLTGLKSSRYPRSELDSRESRLAHWMMTTRRIEMTQLGNRNQDIDDRTEELNDLAQRHPDIWKDFLSNYELSWIYHENALEGIVVTHAEMTSALKGRPIAPDTYPAIRNLKRAISCVRREAAVGNSIDLGLCERIHNELSLGNEESMRDRYRKIIPLHRTYFHDIAQPQHILPRFEKLMEFAKANDPDDEDAIHFCAVVHHDFMKIFPYSEHSGKVGRLLLNYILLRHGYLPVLFHGSERQRYYDMLKRGVRDMETCIVDMMVNCLENGRTYIKNTLVAREKAARKLAHAS